MPPQFHQLPQRINAERTQGQVDKCTNLNDLPTTAAMQGDRLFEWGARGPQLDFAVGNLAACGLANGTPTARNAQNEEPIMRIRKSLFRSCTKCAYKGAFLDPVD